MNDRDEGGPFRLILEGELTIQHAYANRERLLAVLGGHEAVILDLTRVSEIDASGVQLLVAAQKSAMAAGKRLSLADPSQPVREILEFVDLARDLDDRKETGSDHEPR